MDKKFQNKIILSLREKFYFAYKGSSEGRAEPAIRIRIAVRIVEVEIIVIDVDIERVAIGVPIACHCPYMHWRSGFAALSRLYTLTPESYRERSSLKADNGKNFLLWFLQILRTLLQLVSDNMLATTFE